ncbi:hypothetical protein MN608_07163 [Microdochium nivale]|nr:hypothetical protein MN608_07163 [Microdochium nivale]
MRALGPASHFSLDTGSEDLPSTPSAPNSISVSVSVSNPNSSSNSNSKPPALRAVTAPQAINKPPARSRSSSLTRAPAASSATKTAAASTQSESSEHAALTDALARRSRAPRPALHQQAPRARPSIRSSSDSLQPTATQSRPPITLNINLQRPRPSSISPQPIKLRASSASTRSSSGSSTATSTGRSLSASYRSSSSSTSGSASSANPSRRSLGANNTTTAAATGDNRGRRGSFVSSASAASTQHRVPSTTNAAPPASRRPISARLQDDTLRTSAAAGLVKQPLVALSLTPAMPVDRPGQGSASTRPTMPILSAAAMRPANKAPLMPKVAAKGHQGLALSPSVLTTPNPKRMQQSRIGASYPDTDSPGNDAVSPYVAPHVTPRSGTRQVRVDSVNSTPNGTPILDRRESWDPLPGSIGPLSNNEAPSFRRSNTSFSSLPGDHASAAKIESPKLADSKFFHASEVRPSLTRPVSVVKQTPSKPPTFFYANGNNIGDTPPPATQSAPALAQQTQNDGQRKTLYVNGTRELRPSPPLSRGSGSGASAITQKPSGRPGSVSHSGSHSIGYTAQRPPSPVKLIGHAQPLAKKHTASAALGTPPRSHVTSPQPGLASRNSIRRTSSGRSSQIGGHSRAGSLVSAEHAYNAARLISPQLSPSFLAEPVSPLHGPSTPAPLTLASIIQAATEIEDGELSDTSSVNEDQSDGLQSPTKSAASADPINELRANARRERKVQDLEITNASLEAINRTLERQLKKQVTEIRRFKRMSRMSRPSLASAGISSGETSELPNGEQAMDLSLADLSEEGPEQDDELEEDSLSDSESASESLSPSLIAERDARHRTKDEKRLRIDLTKHQEILVDSQKLNQSILRCMSWTEELIREGQKALDYRVRVSEIKIGGRILDPPEDEDRFNNAVFDSTDIDATLAELDDIAADLENAV